MKSNRYILALIVAAFVVNLTPVARAAERAGIKGILISASNERGEPDRRLANYEANLRRILRFESFRYLGEGSASVAVPGSGELSLGEGQSVQLTTESADSRTVLLKVRWGAVRHEYVLQRGSTTVLVGSPTGRKGEVYAVILLGR